MNQKRNADLSSAKKEPFSPPSANDVSTAVPTVNNAIIQAHVSNALAQPTLMIGELVSVNKNSASNAQSQGVSNVHRPLSLIQRGIASFVQTSIVITSTSRKNYANHALLTAPPAPHPQNVTNVIPTIETIMVHAYYYLSNAQATLDANLVASIV